MMQNLAIVIPAIKKNVAFHDDLIKKLNDISLIQRAINKAKSIIDKNIYVVTDSEEISLIAERNKVKVFYDKEFKLKSQNLIYELKNFLNTISNKFEFVILLSPYTPLVDKNIIKDAYLKFKNYKDIDILISVKEERHRVFEKDNRDFQNILMDDKNYLIFIELNSFIILKTNSLNKKEFITHPFILPNETIEIKNYQDWWICEKLLKRKRVIFRVIGSKKLGMGHIYRTLALAHEITSHEIIFVCDDKSEVAVKKLAETDYLIEIFKESELVKSILNLKPDLLIEDSLNTTEKYIKSFTKNGIKVVSFEDLGSGSKFTNLTINELYDEEKLEGKNYKWGYKHYFLRDEFSEAKAHKFKKEIDSVLISFGGTDPSNLTFIVLNTILDYCKLKNIKIYIVAGSGYIYFDKLEKFLKICEYNNIEFTVASGVISKIMEKTPIAFSSNGRTVYELAHLNIPSIIISHHDREAEHKFSKLEHGFINLGVYKKIKDEELILTNFIKLVEDISYRKALFDGIKKFNFKKNKERVVKMILKFIEEK